MHRSGLIELEVVMALFARAVFVLLRRSWACRPPQ
jgi:hypothetical protein